MQTAQDTSSAPLILGFDIFPGGKVSALSWANIKTSTAPAEGVRRWIHLNRLSEDAQKWLGEHSGLDPIAARILTQDDSRPRAFAHANGILMNLRGVNVNDGEDPEDLVSLRIWVTETLIVTTRAFKIKAVEDMAQRLQSGDAPASNGSLVVSLAEALTRRLDPLVGTLDDQMSELEDDFLDEETPAPKLALANFRRKALTLRRYIVPQREAVTDFIRAGDKLLTDKCRLRLREVQDTVTRLSEDLDTIRERAIVVQEQIIEQRSEVMNQRLFVLAIISAIFLPLGFLTGLFGINVGGMPGTSSPHAFWIFAGFLTLVTVGLLLLFKRMKWM
jgi:zinc transporter